ncbi:MAG: aminopeptidase P family protein [Bacteroidota bacterium]|nr:aminopeptidase P family protein [Bacteroidota bacterium]
MFPSNVYKERRNRLRKEIKNGLVLFPGNQEVAYNYPANTYTFRQDSNFLYFFGLDHPDLAAVIDLDEGKDYLFGNDVDMDDIIWMGKQPTMKERGVKVGVENTQPLKDLDEMIRKALAKKRTIHFVTPYRGETKQQLSDLLGIPYKDLKAKASPELIHAIVKLRMEKDDLEIEEIEKMVDVAYIMHTTAMKMAKPGVVEREIAGVLEGISVSHGGPVSFPVILTINGQTLHNHYHGNVLRAGRIMVVDAGSESDMHYASDITRSFPVGGKFSDRQKEIYQIVLNANMAGIAAVKPGVPFHEVHSLAALEIVKGLKDLGFIKGDPVEAVKKGAHFLFFPHGLGHPLGMDVHDLEGLGEDNVGYDDEIKRSTEFGLSSLRFGRRLQKRFITTIEPGIYFIPDLIDLWKSEKKLEDFINYKKVEEFRDFGGIRIEDDVLVTNAGHRVLGRPIPKTIVDVENIMSE